MIEGVKQGDEIQVELAMEIKRAVGSAEAWLLKEALWCMLWI